VGLAGLEGAFGNPGGNGMRKPKTLEKDFQKQVLDYAKIYGWRRAHFRKVRVQRANGSVYWETPVAADGKGFPDLVLVRDTVILVAELKVPGNATSPEQQAWLDAFGKGGALVYVWYPEHWPVIERVLR
jgi:hypothetical protein